MPTSGSAPRPLHARLHRGRRVTWSSCAAISLALALFAGPGAARADEPLSLHFSYTGNADFFATGAAIAIDGDDPDATEVDTIVHPATTQVALADIPDGAVLRRAFLYWGGSIADGGDCQDPTVDDTVSFVAPGMAATEVVAEVCYCSDAGAQAYDVQLCRADVSNGLRQLDGVYEVDDFDALIDNDPTNNASFSIVLIYTAPGLPTRNVSLYDGLLTMWNQGVAEEVVILDQIQIDDPASGDLTWYALEGDVNGEGGEGVSVVGSPGNLSLGLQDGLNPIDNPMNHTINTTTPPQTDALGVDIDSFSIDAALTADDSSVEITYTGGTDKYWIAYNIVGVDIFAPNISDLSTKTWALQDDADQSQDPSPGDTIRYTLYFENTGDDDGLINVNDPMPPQVASWELVNHELGADMSNADTLVITGIPLAPGESTAIDFDVVIADDASGQVMVNIANWDAGADGVGLLQAPPVEIAGETGDGDGDPTTGDGDPTTGDGDGDPATGESGGESGDDSGDGGETQGGGETGTATGPGLGGDAGCGCGVGDTGPVGLGLGLLALIAIRRRADPAG